MGDSTDFISSFHNLEGDLIGERKKNFYKLITNSNLFRNEQELNDALLRLEPKTYLESIFYLETLIYFKRIDQLKEIIKGGNQIFATKIVKQSWFVENGFKDSEAEVLVTDFLPSLSYIVRKKLLTQISKTWNETKMDALFDALEKFYGLAAAVDILHQCSLSKIKSVLEDNELKLRPNQVIGLYKKSHENLEIYLKHFTQVTKSKYSEKKVINYIALKEPKYILELEKDNKVAVFKIGRRTTKGILKVSKEEVSNDIKKYSNFLNNSVIVRTFSPDFKTIFTKIFPNKFNEVNWNSCYLLKYYPKQKRWNLFYTTCSEKFPNKSFNDILSSFNTDITNFEPSKEVIYQWASMLYERQEGDYDTYLKYYPTAKAIQIIKDKINVTSNKSKRQKLMELLLENCAENKDMDSLEEVLKYISVRHQNEDSSVRNDLLGKIKNLFDLSKLNENHWKYIQDHIRILTVQNEFNFYWLFDLVDRHLEFLFKNKKDYTEALNVFMKFLINVSLYFKMDLKNPEIEKDIYSEICKIYPNFVKKESADYQSFTNSFISKMIDFSMDNKKHIIILKNYPYIVDQITRNFDKTEKIDSYGTEIITKTIVYNDTFPQYALHIEPCKILEMFLYVTKEKEKSIWWFTNVLEKVVSKKNRSDLGNELLKQYMDEVIKEYPDGGDGVIAWLLKNEPKTLAPYFETVLKKAATSSFSLDNKLIKLYSHFNFDRKARDYFTQQLETVKKEEVDNIIRLLEALLVLLPTEDFIKIVERFLPKKDKLDLEDEEMRALYKIQGNLTKKLAKVPEPYKMLPTIMQFARGDFLQLVLPALYGAFYNSPQKILYSYVEQLDNRGVSTRKHAIFLSCAVLDKNYTINLLKTKKQSNVSSQKHLFSATLKYFIKNPSKDLLEKVIDNMNTIDKNDTETLDNLKNCQIPTKYRHTYIEKCWTFYESLKPSGIKIKEYLEKMLDYMSQDILISLSEDFVSYIIKEYFSVQTKDRLSLVNHFVVEVLKSRDSEADQNFKLVFEIVSEFKKREVKEFFNSFLQVARGKETKKCFIETFSAYWNTNFTIIQTMEQHIALKLLLIRLDNSETEKYASDVVKYAEQLVNEYSFLVLSIFKNQLIDASTELELKDRLLFYLALLKNNTNSYISVLVIEMLDNLNDDDEDEEEMSVYKNIKDILQNIDVPIVKAYYKSYLTNHN